MAIWLSATLCHPSGVSFFDFCLRYAPLGPPTQEFFRSSVRLLEDFSQVCITQHELVGTCAAGGRTSSKAVGTRQRSKVTNCLAELETCQQLSTFLVCYRRTPLRLHRRMPSMCEGRYTNDASDYGCRAGSASCRKSKNYLSCYMMHGVRRLE